MYINMKKLKKLLIRVVLVVVLLTLIIIGILAIKNFYSNDKYSIGAFMHVEENQEGDNKVGNFNDNENYALDERFQRPSKLPAVKLKFDFKGPKESNKVPPYVAEGFPTIYQSSEDVIHGYYSILKSAANMIGYYGGCGTIAWMDSPYPYAYELFSNDTKENIPLEEFKDSFKGTGAINLLHIGPAFQPANTPDNIKYYFVEVEILKGHKEKNNDKTIKRLPNYFEYYYGIVTTEYDEKEGWKIKSVDYLPEVYMCHPWHGWDYFYDWIIDIIYNDWYGMNLRIDHTEIENNYIKVYANNESNQYRLDFVRLTNGDDILLHEYIKENEKWKEVSLLKPEHEQHYKLSINKFRQI